ncbi:MAG: thioesterase family protein [Halofilum sp. (in: g-proteobacteria)]|nr:thioesterase family protein [Halofilum sp. (in: g-proteobacteria)]
MYPFLKWATTVLRARRRPPLCPGDDSVLECRVGLTDIDLFTELNNARYLHYMELGRWDYSQRVGFVRVMREHKWGIAVGGASIRYRRPIRLFARFTLATRLVCHDGRWFYFLQEVYARDRICASGLMKVGATSSEGLVPAPEVVDALGWEDVWGELPDWVSAWIEAEGKRPWPSG